MKPMKTLTAVAALTALIGCAPYDTAWVSPKYSVSMSPQYADPNFLSPEIVDMSAAWMADGFVGLGFSRSEVEDRLSRMLIVTYAAPWACPTAEQPGQLCAGQQALYTLSVAEVPCVWETALTHEMAHALLETLTGDPDPGHSRGDVWPLAGHRLGTCQ